MREIKKGTMCENCGEREATSWWIGHGSLMDFAHGAGEPWCEQCIVEAQLEYARMQAERIPELERKLAELKSSTEDGDE